MFFRAMAAAVTAGALALTGAAVAQAAPSSNAQLTGPQLKFVLLSASYFGAGYKWAPNNPWDSGSGLEHPVVKVHLSSYSCKQILLNTLPFRGYGETAFAGGQVVKGKGADAPSYYQTVYQFPSVAAATSFYHENYALTARCKTISATSGGKPISLTTQSLTKGHVDGGSAFFDLAKVGGSGSVEVNNDEFVLAGRDVYNVDAFYAVGQARLTPNAATRQLIANVHEAR
jgi:hypothetical protein